MTAGMGSSFLSRSFLLLSFLFLSKTGTMRMERMPRTRETAGSTRGSNSVSTESCGWRVWREAPESPSRVLRGIPRSGARCPVAARQTISLPRTRARAAAAA